MTFETGENHVICRPNPCKSDRMVVVYTIAAYSFQPGWEVALSDKLK